MGIVIALAEAPLIGIVVIALGLGSIAFALRLHKAVSRTRSTQEYRQRLARRKKMVQQIKQLEAKIFETRKTI